MDALIGISVVLLIIGFVTAMIVVSTRIEKWRVDGLATAAEELGLTFMPDGSSPLQERLRQFGFFNQGRNRIMNNLIMGDAGEVKLAIFDYRYTTGSGKNTTTHKMTIVTIESDELVCPPFSLRPENLFDKIGGMLGFQDIDFATHPKFSSLFVLKSPAEEELRAFMKPALLEYFEEHPGMSLEAEPGVLFFYRGAQRAKPEDVKNLFAQAYATYGKIVDG